MRAYAAERMEVLSTGKLALYFLKAAKADLESACNWGLCDIFMGGLIVTMIKHAKINSAKENIRNAMRNLQKYNKSAYPVDYVNQDYLKIGDFALVTDFAFDNVFSDLYVQSKIEDLRGRVSLAVDRVERILAKYDPS